jgi:hypothetical protein
LSVDLQEPVEYNLGFEVRGLGVQESSLDQDPFQDKYTFTSKTRALVIPIEHVRAHLKGLCAVDWPVLEVNLEKCMSLPFFNIWVP